MYEHGSSRLRAGEPNDEARHVQLMSKDEETPRFRVRRSGYEPRPRVTKVRWNRSGGRYDGHPDVEFGAVSIRDLSFSGMRFDRFSAEGATFRNCDFSDVKLEGTFGIRRQTTFEDCVFERARMSNVEPGQARFVGCRFADVDVRGWSAAANEFIDCGFSGLVERCNFWGRPTQEWLDRRLRPPRWDEPRARPGIISLSGRLSRHVHAGQVRVVMLRHRELDLL